MFSGGSWRKGGFDGRQEGFASGESVCVCVCNTGVVEMMPASLHFGEILLRKES